MKDWIKNLKKRLQLNDRWKDFKKLLRIYWRFINRDIVDKTMLILTFVALVLWMLGANVSGFVGVFLVYILGVIWRLGIASELIKEKTKNG